jgi:phenylpropionate dioxygenase-like ring-hydroxylating dioxygenase large terminal subunit
MQYVVGALGRRPSQRNFRATRYYLSPGLMWHDLTSKQFGRTLTVVYATPTRKGECRLFALFPFKFSSKLPGLFLKLTPRWYSHVNQNGVLEDDQIFLHYQERYLEKFGGSANFNKAFYLPTKADLFVYQLHSWINQYNVEPFPGKALSPALPKEVLLDRYHSHTEKCASCRTALRNLQRLRLGLAVVTAVIWALLPLLVVIQSQVSVLTVAICSLAILLSGGIWLGLGNFERRFYQGQETPPRNLPE